MKLKLIYDIIKIKLRGEVNRGMDNETIALEQELVGKTVRETFFELRKEIDERFSEIKEGYLNSRIKSKGDTFIETILFDNDKIHNFRESYYPVIEKKYSITDLEDEFYLNEVYIDISYNQLEEIVQEEYEAWINIDGENYEMKVVFEHDGRYQSKIGRLYEAFKLNGKKWKTVNMAHFKRMYRIKVVRYDFRMTKELYEKIKENRDETVYEFGIYEKNILFNKTLLWNIEEKKIISSIFVRPVKNDISFEYVIKKDENEMLVENNDTGDILCCYSENLNSLHIISRKKLENVWNVFSIKSIQECRKNLMINSITLEEMPEYFHFTNFKKENFIDKLKESTETENRINSKVELYKIFSDYEFIKENFSLKEINIGKDVLENIETYNCNEFIKNDFELFFYNEKINLNLFAECIEKSNYTEDMLSFIVSEIQLRVPEFRCRGYLND